MEPFLSLSNQQQPRRLSALSLTSASDVSSLTTAAAAGASSAAWRSPATPLAAPTPDDELTCTPEDAAATMTVANGNGSRRPVSSGESRRVKFADSTPVRLPYRCLPTKESVACGDFDAEDNPVIAVVPGYGEAATVTATATATSASVLAAPQRGSSLRLQARLQALRSIVDNEDNDADDNQDVVVDELGDIDPDDPRLIEARAKAANAAPGEQIFVGLRRLDVSAGSVERVAVADSAWTTRRPPRPFNRPTASSQQQPPPPDPAEHWRPEEAVSEPSGFDDCGGLADTVGRLLRPGMALAAPGDSFASALRRWTVSDGNAGGLGWRRNCYY